MQTSSKKTVPDGFLRWLRNRREGAFGKLTLPSPTDRNWLAIHTRISPARPTEQPQEVRWRGTQTLPGTASRCHIPCQQRGAPGRFEALRSPASRWRLGGQRGTSLFRSPCLRRYKTALWEAPAPHRCGQGHAVTRSTLSPAARLRQAQPGPYR